MTESSARSRSPARAPVSIVSRSFLASAGERTGVAPFRDDVLRPPHRRGGVHREDLADDEPVAEHADRGQVLLHRRDRPGASTMPPAPRPPAAVGPRLAPGQPPLAGAAFTGGRRTQPLPVRTAGRTPRAPARRARSFASRYSSTKRTSSASRTAAGADAVRGPRSASGSPAPARPGAEPTRRPAASPPLAPPPRPRRRDRCLTASPGGRCPPRGPHGPGSPTRR